MYAPGPDSSRAPTSSRRSRRCATRCRGSVTTISRRMPAACPGGWRPSSSTAVSRCRRSGSRLSCYRSKFRQTPCTSKASRFASVNRAFRSSISNCSCGTGGRFSDPVTGSTTYATYPFFNVLLDEQRVSMASRPRSIRRPSATRSCSSARARTAWPTSCDRVRRQHARRVLHATLADNVLSQKFMRRASAARPTSPSRSWRSRRRASSR